MNAIVCIDMANGIGMDGNLLYRIPGDLKDFKTNTSKGECNVVIMGRKTYESIGRPLPGRLNIVLTTRNIKIPGVIVAHTVSEVLKMVSHLKECCVNDNVFVIGGSDIYALFIDHIKTIYVSRVFDHKKHDVSFDIPVGFARIESKCKIRHNDIQYRHEKYLNIKYCINVYHG